MTAPSNGSARRKATQQRDNKARAKRKAELKPALEAFIQNEAPAIVAETKRRAAGKDGKFDGLLGGLPEGAATLIESLLTLHRDYLLLVFGSDPDGAAKIRTLLREHTDTRAGFKAVTPIVAGLPIQCRDAVRLAIHTIGAIAEALPQEGDERGAEYVWTRIAGATGAKVKGGGKKGGDALALTRKVTAAAEHAQWVKHARSLLNTHTATRRTVTHQTAEYFKRSEQVVRPALQAAGLIPPAKGK